MAPDKDSIKESGKISSFDLKIAFDHHLYVSSQANTSSPVLCYDAVLCYLSNVLAEESLVDIENTLHRYFSTEDINQACFNLRNCMDYVLSTMDINKNHSVYSSFQECSKMLTDETVLLPVMDNIHMNQLFSYLPIFVTNDWIRMIRNIQNTEKFEQAKSSIINIQRQISNLKDNLMPLNELVENIEQMSSTTQSPLSTFNDQCCLRTYCTHNSSVFHRQTSADSRSSSWTSLNIDTNPITKSSGFIRNPVTNFMIPTRATLSEKSSSTQSIGNYVSSDDEEQISSRTFIRSLSYQPPNQTTGSVLVKRDDALWVYPAGVVPAKYNTMFSFVNEDTDLHVFGPARSRANSCDDAFPIKKMQSQLPPRKIKKQRKSSVKLTKGSRKIIYNIAFFL